MCVCVWEGGESEGWENDRGDGEIARIFMIVLKVYNVPRRLLKLLTRGKTKNDGLVD